MIKDPRIKKMFDTVKSIMPEETYKAFKIMEKVDGDTKVLFHGLNGSRTIPHNVWLAATQKMCKDGTSKTMYMSGWHVLPTRKECEEYLKVFKNRLDILEIVECKVSGLRKKEHSPSNVWLAEQIYIGE